MRKENSLEDVEAFFKKYWNTIATIVLLCCLGVMIYYGLMMFKMGRDPCALCMDMVGMTCYSPQMPTF